MAFENSGIKFCQLHGDQSTFERTCQLNTFMKDPNVEAFVVSIEAGGVGLNMTCADEVYLMVSQVFTLLLGTLMEQLCIFRMHIGTLR